MKSTLLPLEGLLMISGTGSERSMEVLCFGDSNTWGYNPADGSRYDRKTRWPCVMASDLGSGWHIVEEGLSGRTTVFEDEIEAHRRGLDAIVMLLETHWPLDLVIIMLGTNDLKCRFGVVPRDISLGWARIIKTIRERSLWFAGKAPEILLVSPPPVREVSTLNESFAGAPEKSTRFAETGRRVAQEVGCLFFDAGSTVSSSPVDGIHLSAESQIRLGHSLAEQVRGWAPR